MKPTSTLAVLGAGYVLSTRRLTRSSPRRTPQQLLTHLYSTRAVFADNVTNPAHRAATRILPTGTNSSSSLTPHCGTTTTEERGWAHRYPRGPSSLYHGYYPVTNATSAASDYVTGSGFVTGHVSSSSSGDTVPTSIIACPFFSAAGTKSNGTSPSSNSTTGYLQPTTLVTSSRESTPTSSQPSSRIRDIGF